jgi:zinc protease
MSEFNLPAMRIARGLSLFGPAALCLSMATGATTVKGKIPNRYQDIQFPDWSYVAPKPTDFRVELKHGALAYLVPDSTLNLVKVSIYSGATNQAKKPEEVASLNLYSTLLKSGGAAQWTPEQLEDSLEFVAAGMNASLSDWQGSITLDCLSENAGELIQLMPDLVLKPRLDTAVFRVQQREYMENWKHRYATPRGVIAAAYEKAMHGSHPTNWMATDKEIESVSAKPLQAWVGRGFPANRLVFAVAGRFDKTKMLATLNALVERFPKTTGRDSVKPYAGAVKPGVYLVDKPFTQATLRIASPAVQRPHPDYYRLIVASYVFGDGGFTSRLVEKVRSNEGLAYGVSSDVESDYYRKGSVSVSLQTKVETGAYAIDLVLKEMKRMADSGITPTELEKAKDGLLKSMPAMFDSPDATARIFAQGELWKRDMDHFVQFEKTIKAMTKAEVEDAFRRYFVSDSMRIVVVGPKSALLAKDSRGLALDRFGTVTEWTEADLDSRR